MASTLSVKFALKDGLKTTIPVQLVATNFKHFIKRLICRQYLYYFNITSYEVFTLNTQELHKKTFKQIIKYNT